MSQYNKDYYQSHKEEIKAYYEAPKEERRAKMRAYYESHKERFKAYLKADNNHLGETKNNVRRKSNKYLSKYGTKIIGYEIHHCCGYTEPYKFIYCSKEIHNQIHSYLREHNIPADSDHYEQIKHLLNDNVVLYNIIRG